MAEGRRYALNPQLDIQQILFEARSRWLRPSEICEILRNYRMFNITPDPPYKPPGGSLFLFDRKALRYFRKDGHRWRKKKDGKTVREAHEKLKSGSVDVLHCYYAHGEDNENFQRRSYWMLDGQLEHIVLVHYRDLNEGNSPGVPQFQGAQTSSAVGSSHTNSSTFMNQASYASSTSNADWNAQATSAEFEDADSADDFGSASLAESVSGSRFQVASLPGNRNTENISLLTSSICHPYGASLINSSCLNRSMSPFISNQVASQNLILSEGQNVHGASHITGSFELQFDHNCVTPTLSEFLSLKQKHTDTEEQNMPFQQMSCFNAPNRRPTDSISQNGERIEFGLHGGYKVLAEPYSQPFTGDGIANVQVKEEYATGANHPVANDIINKDSVHTYDLSHEHQLQLAPPPETNGPPECKTEVPSVLKNTLRRNICDDELGELKKLDSFGRWMDKELGKDCDDSLMASDSYTYWNAIDTQNDDKEVSSLSGHMQLDVDSVAPLLSQEQLFSILDFSPDWAYSGDGAKVLISGVFLGKIQPKSIKWCCMFGEVEVSAEVLTTNSIRCQAPTQGPGRVAFYITCSDRLACSEVREFEYRENPSCTAFPFSHKRHLEDEMYLQIRFAKILSLGSEKKRLLCPIENCDRCNMKKILFQLLVDDEAEWEKIEEESKAACQGYWRNLRDALLEKLLKGRLYEWLASKLHEDGKGPSILDDEGQGAIHLAAALGYEWAMTAIVAAGVHPSFRDVHGRTALHWAAYYGREQTLVTLLKLGSAPGAVEDPTSKFPEGQTASDLASSSGHKGIAGYLAEADLTSHLVSMSLSENVVDSVAATLAAENSVEIVEVHSIVSVDDRGGQTSLRESLAAVRNSAQAAARIQAAFRVQSFCQRQLTITTDKTKISDEMMALPSLFKKIHRIGQFNFNDSLHAAAIKIQQKYRGWKGRKEFLKIRDRIVKIQAHVRGHQVRKQYKRVVWSVSIVEKVILRWRRKGSGLRGFRAEKATGDAEQEAERTDEYEFLRLGRKQKVAGIEKALARVKSMVRYPEARDQYMRLVASSNKSELRVADCSSDQACSSNEETSVEKGPLAPLMN